MRSSRLQAIARPLRAAQCSQIARLCTASGTHALQAEDRPHAIPLSNPAYIVWGANTDVGKTLVCAGIAAAAVRSRGQLLYVKPVQTGFPIDSDARLVAAAARAGPELGAHASELQMSGSFADTFSGRTSSPTSSLDCACKTLFAWRAPVSPHLAAQQEGRLVGDAAVRAATLLELQGFAGRAGGTADALALVESAGGPASPMPSGTLQCEAWQPLHLPGILVADPRLGGISTTISAYETLALRGSPPVAIVTLQQSPAALDGSAPTTINPAAGNAAMLDQHFRGMVPIVELPQCRPPAGQNDAYGVDEALQSWLESSHHQLVGLTRLLRQAHLMRCERLRKLPGQAMSSIWWPFTQHAHMTPSKVLCIDARAGESLLVASPTSTTPASHQAPQGPEGLEQSTGRAGELQLKLHYDACCSWWTQGVSQEFQPRLVAAMAGAAARYGHVMHPETASEPAVQLATKLLSSAGQGWADRVFYSDDGSTAVEVALKMALRKFRRDQGDVEGTRLQVVGLAEGYHGDTLGAMDAVSPSAYTGLPHAPWYESRGLFFQPPMVGLKKGLWTVDLPKNIYAAPMEYQLTWASLDDVLDTLRDGTALADLYRRHIQAGIDRHLEQAAAAGAPVRLAACLIEPLIQGAGGMIQPDPMFQRLLVHACRARGLPVIFDEVFAGMWRLGVVSSSQLLGVQPDIAAYAKLLTGGMMPLSVTLASDAVFQAFSGPSKLDGLLHGHSYAGNPVGCAVALEALSIYEEVQDADAFSANPDTVPGSHPAAEQIAPKVEPGQQLQPCMAPFWDESAVIRLSQLPNVERVVCLGTVLAATIEAEDGGGYASKGTAQIIASLREAGVFARPLGNVVYIMVTPTSSRATCAWLLQELNAAVQAAAPSKPGC